MTVNVLGPLAVDGDAEPLAPRDRVVLAALSMSPHEALSADRLADALWGDDPPASWTKQVQACIVRIRKALGTESVRTTRQGYVLDVPEDGVDAFRFERLLRRGRELLALHEPERARYTLMQALDLWYGVALADLDGWAPGEAVARRLEERRQDAEELVVEAALRSGAWREVLTEAGRLVADQPYREARWALLARAQYQAGRQAEALTTLQRARAVLAGDLGLDPGEELATLEESILRQDPELLPASEEAGSSPACPYRGLLFYDVDDTEQFFGRDAELGACREVLAQQGHVAVVGPSGSGKSSLVRAGIAASLRREGRSVVVMTPGAHPMTGLAEAGGLRPRAVLVVDQLEEAVALCDDAAERGEFLDALVAHEDAGADVVLALRADRLAQLSVHRAFARLLENGLHLLGGMDEEGLRTAIEAPARQAGLLLEPGLVDVLVHEVSGEPGALPLLSHALAQTWQRREGRTLTVEGYRASGGIQGAVAQTAERVFVGLNPKEQRTARDLMLRLVMPTGPGEAATRSPVPRRIAAPDRPREEIVEMLVAARLVTADDDVVALAHESLARAWPRLRSWLDADAEGQLILRHLTLAADSWQAMGRPDSELYRGPRLARALEWRGTTEAHLTETEVTFLDASGALAREESRSAEQRLHEQARSNRRLRALLGGVMALLLVALGAGVVAIKQGSRADEQARLATVSDLAAESRAARADDPQLALLLALEASSPALSGGGSVPREAVEALHAAVLASRLDYATEDGGGAVAWSPGGDLVATEGPEDSGLVDIRDAATGESVSRFPGHDLDVNDVAFGPGGVLATAGDDGALRVWGSHDEQALAEVKGEGEVWGPSFARSGRPLVAAAWPDEAKVRVVSLSGHSESPRTVAELSLLNWPVDTSLSPDGASVAIGTLNPDDARVVDVRSGEIRYRLRGHDAELTAVAHSPDGRWLATADNDGLVRVVEAATGRTKHTVSDATSGITSLAWATDSTRLAAGGWDGAIRVHEVTDDGVRTTIELGTPSHGGGVQGLAFSPDGSRLLSGDVVVSAATAWDVGAGGDAEVMNVPAPRTSAGAAFDPDGRLFTPGEAGTVNVWQGDPERAVAHLEAPESFEPAMRMTRQRGSDTQPATPPPRSVAVSADGALVGTGVGPAGATIWDVDTGEPLYAPPPRWMWRPAFSPDGRHFALGGEGTLTVRTAEGQAVASRSASDLEFADPTFSPDGRSVAYRRFPVDESGSADTELMLWNWEADTVRSVYAGTGHQPAISPGGNRLAIADIGEPPRVLDLTTGAVAFELEGHASGVADVTYSPDGSRIATAGLDGTVIIWNAGDGSLLLRLPALSREISTVAFSPDGRHLATGSIVEDVVRVWTLDVAELRGIADDRVVRGLTDAECEEYLHRRSCPSR